MNYRYRKIQGPQRQEPLKNVPPGYWSAQEAQMRAAWMRDSMPTAEDEAPLPIEIPRNRSPRNPVLLLTTPLKWAISTAAVLVVGALWWRQSLSRVPESACNTFECQLPQWKADAQADEVVLHDILHDASLTDELISESL
ncbi:MAG: hypothetical protein RJA19_1274 [Bacteroidota bacterium]|jgi:hypothetical protein